MHFGNVVSDFKRWGLARAAFIRVMSGLERYAGLHVSRLFVRPVHKGRLAIDVDPRISIRMARPEELYKAARDPALELDPLFVRDALARGDSASGAFEGGDLVAYNWRTSTAAPHLDGLWVRVGAPYGYSYKTFTRKSHRGRRLAVAVSLFSDAYGVARGCTDTVEFVEVTNYSSLSVERATGGKAAGYVGYVKCFGRIFTFRCAAARRMGLDFCTSESKPPSLASAGDPRGEYHVPRTAQAGSWRLPVRTSSRWCALRAVGAADEIRSEREKDAAAKLVALRHRVEQLGPRSEPPRGGDTR